MNKIPKHLIGISLMCLIVLAGILFFEPGLKTDDYLISEFKTDRADLESLVNLIVQDPKVIAVSKYHVQTDSGYYSESNKAPELPAERHDEYMRLLDRVGISFISRRAGIIEIGPVTSTTKDLDDGATFFVTKGYAYSPITPKYLVDSLYIPATYETLYRRIEGDWYIYLDSGISKPE